MDPGPLVSERIGAGAKFLAELDKRLPVKIAFWLKKADAIRWYLYVVSAQVDEGQLGASYREVVEAGRQVRDPNFDVFEVKLIASDDPLACGVCEIVGPSADAVPVRLFDRIIGNVSAAEIYIYPVPLPAAAS